MAADEEEEKGFVVKDRRSSYDDADPEESTPPAPESSPAPDVSTAPAPSADVSSPAEASQHAAPRELTFQSFVYSLASSALMLLGGEAKEGSEPSKPNLPQASEIIEILTILQEKTNGNLTPEEVSLLKDMLYTLRIMYVERAAPKT